jgi:hypothetical protein
MIRSVMGPGCKRVRKSARSSLAKLTCSPAPARLDSAIAWASRISTASVRQIAVPSRGGRLSGICTSALDACWMRLSLATDAPAAGAAGGPSRRVSRARRTTSPRVPESAICSKRAVMTTSSWSSGRAARRRLRQLLQLGGRLWFRQLPDWPATDNPPHIDAVTALFPRLRFSTAHGEHPLKRLPRRGVKVLRH